MRYKIRERIFSIGDNFVIRDEYDNEKFIVKEELLTLGKKLRIMSLDGKELIYIKQELLTFMPKYNIYSEGNHLATVNKEFTFFKPKFNIDSNSGYYSVEGDVFSHDFVLIKDNEAVATINKQWFSLSDTYGIDIKDDLDQAFILSLVIVIDQVLHDKKN